MSTVPPGAHLATHTDPVCPKLTAGSVWSPGHLRHSDAVVGQKPRHMYAGKHLHAGDRSRLPLPYSTPTWSENDEGEGDSARVVDGIFHAVVHCNVRASGFDRLACGASWLGGVILIYPSVHVVKWSVVQTR